MKKKIVQNGAPVLRERAREVALTEISHAKIGTLLADMGEALLGEDDGVALAAPQIGVSLRIFIVSVGALALPETLKGRDKEKERKAYKREHGFLTFINPRMTKLSREKISVEEGCLSVRPLYGLMKRAKQATITAYDARGKRFTRGASGLLAQVFQHECDHLDGILFIDHATNLQALAPRHHL